jgi:hypothetical protein
MLSLNTTFVLHAENWGVLIWSSRPIHATELIVLKYSLTPSSVSTRWVLFVEVKNIGNNVWFASVIINARINVLKAGFNAVFEGPHSAHTAACCHF